MIIFIIGGVRHGMTGQRTSPTGIFDSFSAKS